MMRCKKNTAIHLLQYYFLQLYTLLYVVESIKPAADTNLISESHQTCSASNGATAAHPDQGASNLHNSTEQSEHFSNTDDSHKSSHTSNNPDTSQVLESSHNLDRGQVLESSHQDISETGSDVDLFADDEDEDISCVIEDDEDDVTDFEGDDQGEGFTALKGKAVCQSTQLPNPEASMCRLVLLTTVMRIDLKQGCQFNQSLNHIDAMRANSYIEIKLNACIRT